jgi:hypothetical protein
MPPPAVTRRAVLTTGQAGRTDGLTYLAQLLVVFEHVVVLATEPVQLSLGLQQLCTHRRRLADLLEGLPTGHRSKTRRPATDAHAAFGSAHLV